MEERTSEGEEGSRDEAPLCEGEDVRVSDDIVNDLDGEVGEEGRVQHGARTRRRKSKGNRSWG